MKDCHVCAQCGGRGHRSVTCGRLPVAHPSDPTAMLVPLTRGMFATIDAADVALVAGYHWYAKRDRTTWYAVASTEDSPGSRVRLHRLLTGAALGMVVDHRDHDGLNNRRSNLRVCTIAQNGANRNKQDGTSSPYKGVAWIRDVRKWRAQIRVSKKRYHIGNYLTELEAAAAYDQVARVVFGEYAQLNFPTPEQLVAKYLESA